MNKNKTAKPIKVCFIAPKAYPLFNPEVASIFGGAEVDLYLLSTELAQNPLFQASFIVADYDQPACVDINNVTIYKSLNFKQNALIGAWKIWQAMRQADADIYFLEAASTGMALAAVFCKFFKRKFVYRTASALECDGTWFRIKSLAGRLMRWGMLRADIVIVQNANDQKNLERTTGRQGLLIPNAQNLNIIRPTKKDVIIWVGRSDTIKGPYRFLKLATEVPEEKFLMVCPQATGDNHYDQLVQQAASIPNLEFVTRVPFDKIDESVSRARVLVNTSDSEGFPNVFIHACKAAVPILSLNVNPDGFLDRYQCGICSQGDPVKMPHDLKTLLDENHFQTYSRNARRYAEEHHDISRIILIYQDLFRKLYEPDQETY